MNTASVTVSFAVLITCYNRKNKTLSCLQALFGQALVAHVNLQVFLVDDGCTDGTGDAVSKQYPQVTILQGTGDLYWNGGMRLAFGEAMKGEFDYYLWLNDDVRLYPDAIHSLLKTSIVLEEKIAHSAIIVGSVKDERTGVLTYGGNRIRAWWAPLSYWRVLPQHIPVPCDAINGNCVLIPKKIAKTVGNLNNRFTHGGGDYDYSLRAKKLGFPSYVAPGYFGVCPLNTIAGTIRDKKLPLAKRREILDKPTALPAATEWMYFAKCHAGFLWPLYWLRTSLRICFPKLWLFCRGKIG